MPIPNSSNHAVSPYAPIRRNSLLQDPVVQTTLAGKLSTLSLGLTLLVIRCWKDASLWPEVLARLPLRWQKIVTVYWQKWQGTTAGFLRGALRQLLHTLQEQLAPFLVPIMPPVQQQANKQQDAPTSILCDGASSTQFTSHWSDSYEDRVRQNQSLIRKVLGYWFGQYEPDQAQKKLWMIANSSVDHRKQVDAEIADLFTPLLLELATAGADGTNKNGDTNNLPQPASPTTTTAGTAKPAAATAVQPKACRWQQWCADKDMYGYAGKLAAIIVLDQFSRHIRRHHEEQEEEDGLSSSMLPPQPQLDSLALRTARLLTEGHAQEIKCGMVPTPQYIFGLMPYRHASTLASVQHVQTCVEQAASINLQLQDMTSRFRKATNRRLAVLQDEARRTGKATTAEEAAKEEGATTTSTPSSNAPQQFSDEDVLEMVPFEADTTDAKDHVIVKTIQSFLADRGIYPVGGSAAFQKNSTNQKKGKKKKKDNKKNQKGNPHQQQQQQQQQQRQINNSQESTDNAPLPPTCSVIISLSGGVDSMVIAAVLSHLKTHLGYPHLNIVAIHIDYANRPESKAESDYVEKFCAQKGIRFVVRRIEEVTRGITARDEYEQRARQMRYDMYRSVALECLQQQTQQDQQKGIVGVMLGHHRGDLRENVLSNAHKGCGPLDLSGMTAVSQNDGVAIYRPLLPLEKTEVYDYSHRYGVPYFKDTTPHWSTRGKLRNKLLPLLEEIYGEGSMNNLSTLATESDECRDLLHNTLLKPFMDRVVRTPMGIIFETAPFVAQARGLFFWKFVLREVLHSAGMGMFSDKSVIAFLERIMPVHTFKKTIREGWLQCRRDYAVYLQGDGKIFVFYPDSLPWRKADGFKCRGEDFDMKKQSTLAIGPWIIEAEQCEVEVEKRPELLQRKAIASMTEFMKGFVEYYLEVPTIMHEEGNEDHKTMYTPLPLVFAPSFQKETRPTAWKSTDEKLQETLPLLGLTVKAAQELKCPTTDNPVALVRVTLDRRFSPD